MSRDYFLKSNRIGFSKWNKNDLDLAILLWGNKQVSKYICASGIFFIDDIKNRLALEINNENKYGVEYWPIFDLSNDKFMGCCGLRPRDSELEIGIHLLPEYWHLGYGSEACKALIDYSFKVLKVNKLFAGHNPNNINSKKLLNSLGFKYIGDEYYEPTGLMHPSYELTYE